MSIPPSRCAATRPARVVLNLAARWPEGVDHYDADLDTYRRYLVNHEIGHRLRHGTRCARATVSRHR